MDTNTCPTASLAAWLSCCFRGKQRRLTVHNDISSYLMFFFEIFFCLSAGSVRVLPLRVRLCFVIIPSNKKANELKIMWSINPNYFWIENSDIKILYLLQQKSVCWWYIKNGLAVSSARQGESEFYRISNKCSFWTKQPFTALFEECLSQHHEGR